MHLAAEDEEEEYVEAQRHSEREGSQPSTKKARLTLKRPKTASSTTTRAISSSPSLIFEEELQPNSLGTFCPSFSVPLSTTIRIRARTDHSERDATTTAIHRPSGSGPQHAECKPLYTGSREETGSSRDIEAENAEDREHGGSSINNQTVLTDSLKLDRDILSTFSAPLVAFQAQKRGLQKRAENAERRLRELERAHQVQLAKQYKLGRDTAMAEGNAVKATQEEKIAALEADLKMERVKAKTLEIGFDAEQQALKDAKLDLEMERLHTETLKRKLDEYIKWTARMPSLKTGPTVPNV